MPAKVTWRGYEVRMAVDKATDEMLTRLAFQGEGIAKAGAPVDTGFLRNAIYAIVPGGSHRAQAEADATAVLAGTTEARGLVSEATVGEHEAAIHAAAEYSIYQEERTGFLYAALEALQGYLPGIAREVGLEVFGG